MYACVEKFRVITTVNGFGWILFANSISNLSTLMTYFL
jgi:hypothetical protein